jgi:hypothetical protein
VRLVSLLVVAPVLGAVSVFSPASFAQVVASEVVGYSNPSESTFNVASVALGLPPRSGPFGDLTPFNPNFGAANIVRIQPGGSITLKLSSAVPANASRTLGVVSNIGIADFSDTGTGVAGNPASSFSSFPVARVSVSDTGSTYVPLNAGNLITFNMPAAGFTNTPAYDNYSPTGGTIPSDFSKPTPALVQDGGFASFDGKSHSQILALLDGSGGGQWLSLGSSGLSSVQYVRFEVPSDAPGGSRFILDAVVAVPEPTVLAIASAGALLALKRRR